LGETLWVNSEPLTGALLRPGSLEFGGVGIYDSEDRWISSDQIKNVKSIIAKILHQSKANENIIIDSKVGDDH
jgi:hypothetical protein